MREKKSVKKKRRAGGGERRRRDECICSVKRSKAIKRSKLMPLTLERDEGGNGGRRRRGGKRKKKEKRKIKNKTPTGCGRKRRSEAREKDLQQGG